MSTNEENELLCQLAGKELALADANKLADEALAQVATLEQENDRLREGIQAMHKRANAVKYNQISLAWVLNELAALLAQPEAKGEPDA